MMEIAEMEFRERVREQLKAKLIIDGIISLAELLKGEWRRALEFWLDEIPTLASAYLTANPDLFASYEIERAKKALLKEWSKLLKNDELEFSIYEVQRDGARFHPSLRDFRIAKRHLDAEDRLNELLKTGPTSYKLLVRL